MKDKQNVMSSISTNGSVYFERGIPSKKTGIILASITLASRTPRGWSPVYWLILRFVYAIEKICHKCDFHWLLPLRKTKFSVLIHSFCRIHSKIRMIYYIVFIICMNQYRTGVPTHMYFIFQILNWNIIHISSSYMKKNIVLGQIYDL